MLSSQIASGSKPAPMISLSPCPRFQETINEARGHYATRYKKTVTLPELLAKSLNYILSIPADEFYERIWDCFDYNQRRMNGVRATPEITDLLIAVRAHLESTAQLSKGMFNLTDRGISCAAMYLYCNTLINHHGKPFVKVVPTVKNKN